MVALDAVTKIPKFMIRQLWKFVFWSKQTREEETKVTPEQQHQEE